MGEELRTCPYCAKEMQRRAHIADRGHFVWCGNCGAFGPNDITPEHAARMWNLRRPEDALRAELEQVKAENARLRTQVADLYGSLGSWYVDVVGNEERETERLRIEDLFYMLTVGESEGLPHIGDTVYVFDGNTEMRELVYNGEQFGKFERWILVKPAEVNDGNDSDADDNAE